MAQYYNEMSNTLAMQPFESFCSIIDMEKYLQNNTKMTKILSPINLFLEMSYKESCLNS